MTRRLLLFGTVVLALVVGGWLAAGWLLEPSDTPATARIDAAAHDTLPPAASADAVTPEDRAVRLTSVTGRVERQRPGAGWQPAKVGDRLTETEAVRTGPAAAARLVVGKGGSELEVANSSELSVREITRVTHRFRLKEGRLGVEHRGDGKRMILIEGRDGKARVRARDGRFGVIASGGSLAVATGRGEVDLRSAGKSVKVRAGQRSVARDDQPPSDPLAIPKEVLLSIAGMGRSRQVSQPSTTVSGRTRPGNRLIVARRTITTDKQGKFSARIDLEPGPNRVAVVAETPDGRRKEGAVTLVYRQPTQPSPRSNKPRRGKITDINIQWGK